MNRGAHISHAAEAFGNALRLVVVGCIHADEAGLLVNTRDLTAHLNELRHELLVIADEHGRNKVQSLAEQRRAWDG